MASKSHVCAISLRPNEIVVNDVAVTLDAPRALDLDIAPKDLCDAGVDGEVRVLDGRKRPVWTPRRPLPPGRYQFVLGELASAPGARLSVATVTGFGTRSTLRTTNYAIVTGRGSNASGAHTLLAWR